MHFFCDSLIDVSMKNCALQSNSHDSAFAYCKRTVHLIVSHSSDFSSQDASFNLAYLLPIENLSCHVKFVVLNFRSTGC